MVCINFIFKVKFDLIQFQLMQTCCESPVVAFVYFICPKNEDYFSVYYHMQFVMIMMLHKWHRLQV